LPVRLTICSTCAFSKMSAFDDEGNTGGQLLSRAIKERAATHEAEVEIVDHACLWACTKPSNVLIEQNGKTGYLAGGFKPGPEAADAILDWCAAYDRSVDGEVDFADWPHGMLGRFIARIPVPPRGDRG